MKLVNLLKRDLRTAYHFGGKLIQEYLTYCYVMLKEHRFYKKADYINLMLNFQMLYSKIYILEDKLISISKNMHLR